MILHSDENWAGRVFDAHGVLIAILTEIGIYLSHVLSYVLLCWSLRKLGYHATSELLQNFLPWRILVLGQPWSGGTSDGELTVDDGNRFMSRITYSVFLLGIWTRTHRLLEPLSPDYFTQDAGTVTTEGQMLCTLSF
jgi:hypothetical protein